VIFRFDATNPRGPPTEPPPLVGMRQRRRSGASSSAPWRGAAGNGPRAMDLARSVVRRRRSSFCSRPGEIYTTLSPFSAAAGSLRQGRSGLTTFFATHARLCALLFLLSPIWRYGKEHGLYSQRTFLRPQYDSPLLASIVAIVGSWHLIPYLACSSGDLASSWKLPYGAVPRRRRLVSVLRRYRLCDGLSGRARSGVDVGRPGCDEYLFVVVFLGIYYACDTTTAGSARCSPRRSRAEPASRRWPAHPARASGGSHPTVLLSRARLLHVARLRHALYARTRGLSR